MLINVCADPDRVADAAAATIARCVRMDVAERGTCVLAFSGGTSPRPLLAALAATELPWEAVHVFQVDERVAPDGHSDRNLALLIETLAGVLPADRLHAMPVTDPASGAPQEGADLDVAALDYALRMRAIAGDPPVLDVVHLGLGADGHTASLVPGDPVLDVGDAEVAVTAPFEGRRRMTLTYPALDRARRILWQVVGADRAEAVRDLVTGGTSPAARVAKANAELVVDAAAAALIEA